MNIAQTRARLGLTQAQFWNRISVTQTAGSRYESSKRPLPEQIAKLLTIAYGNLREARRTVDALRA